MVSPVEGGAQAVPPANLQSPIDLDPNSPDACARLIRRLADDGFAIVQSTHFDQQVGDQLQELIREYLVSGLQITNGRPRLVISENDVRPDLGYQFGFTPPGTEVPLVCQSDRLDASRRLFEVVAPGEEPFTVPGCDRPDPKGRFLANLITYRGESPISHGNDYPSLEVDPLTTVVPDPRNTIPTGIEPARVDEVTGGIHRFGRMMLNAVTETAKMIAAGLGLDPFYFVGLTNRAHHKIAPAFASLYDSPDTGTVLAGLHQHIDLLSIRMGGSHGGLVGYTSGGRRIELDVPPGCFLVQSGRQLYLKMRSMQRTGEISREPIAPAWHEVVVTEELAESVRPLVDEINRIVAADLTTVEKLAQIRPRYKELLRVSLTFFYHLGDDTVLVYGLSPGSYEEDLFSEGTVVGDYVRQELSYINLDEDATPGN